MRPKFCGTTVRKPEGKSSSDGTCCQEPVAEWVEVVQDSEDITRGFASSFLCVWRDGKRDNQP